MNEEDARLLAEWQAGPGSRPTPEEGKRWLEQAHRFPRVCSGCRHETSSHSSEPGVGCLHVLTDRYPLDSHGYCPCLRSGTSRADQ